MGKIEKVGKKLKVKSFAFFVVLSIISVFSCEIGLGAAVDVAAPTSGISYPPQNAVVRDTFVAAGICEDDMEVISVKVTVTNTEDNSTYGPYDATLAEDKKSWTITLNNKDPSKSTSVFDSYRQWEIPDGNYVISAVAYDDAEKESPAATLPISIDNTAPVLIVSKPLAVGSEAATEYGRSFTLAGDIAEEHQTSKITLSYREYSGSSFTDSVKSIELSNFGSMSSSNPLVIAKYYNNSVAMNDEKTKLRNTYLHLYGRPVNEVNKADNVDKTFYGAFQLEDNARVYNNPGDSGSGTGNQTSEYYILSNAVSELFGSAYSLDVTKLMQIINGKTTYSASDITKITDVLNGNKASSTEITMEASSKFTINPNNSPLWAIDGYGVDGYEASLIEEQVNAQGEVTSEGAKKYTAGNILTLTVKAGRDNVYIKPNTVEARLYQLRKNSSNVYEIDPDYYSGNGKVIIAEEEWTDPAADSATTQISLDVTEHGLVNDKYYEIKVTGVDRSIDRNKYPNESNFEPEAVHYIFKLSSNGAAPIIEFTEGLNRSWKKGADITSSFDITGKIISSTNIIRDNVTINSFNVRDNNDATNSITINAHGDTSFGAGSTSAEYPFTIHVTPTSGNLVPSAPSKYTYNITIRAEDDATASGMKTLTLFVDNKEPTLNISGVSPVTAAGKVNGKITVRGTVSDNESGLNSLTYKVYKVLNSSNDEEVIAERNITASNSWNFEFNTTELTAEGSGDYKIVIKAVDKVGNEKKDESTIIHVDQTTDTPEISLSNATWDLAEDAIDADHNLFDTVSNRTLYGSVTDDDGIDKVEIMWYKSASGDWIAFDGPKPTVNKNGKVATFNCQMPSTEGLYTIKIKATDTLGETTKNAKEIEFPVAVNNGAPQILNMDPESSESNYVKGTLPVSGKIKDSTGQVTITAVHTSPEGSSETATSAIVQPEATVLASGANWSDTITLPDVSGRYSVTYTAENKYHQTSTHTIVYSVDVTTPVLGTPSVNKENFNAANDYWNNGNVPLKVIVTDAGSGVEKVGYSLTDSNNQSDYEDFTAAGNTWSGNVSIGDAESVPVYVRAVDKKGNAAKTSITVKIDNYAPKLAQTKYKVGTGEAVTVADNNKVYVKADESLTVYGSYSDTPAGVKALSFTLGGVSITPTVTYATKALDDESLVEADFVAFNESNKTTIKSWRAGFAATSLANTLSDAALVVKGKDYAGNTVTAEGLSLTKDVDAPNIGGIKIISGTDKNAYKDKTSGKYYLRNTKDGSVTIEGSTTDSNLKETKIVVQGLLSDGTSAGDDYKIAPDDAVTSSKWSFTNLDMNWPETVTGASVTITAIDKSGNSTDETINIEFDETKPKLDFTPYNVINYKFRGQNVVKYSSVKIGQGTYSESSYGQLSSIDFTFYYEEKGSSFSKIQYQLLTADQTDSADQIIDWNDNASDGRRSGTLNVVRGSENYGYSEYTYYDGESPVHKGLKVSGTISGFTHTQGQNKKNLLLIRAVDNCGNASEPQLLKVLVDQTAPTVEFDEYTGTKVNGNILTNGTSSITLTGTAKDVDAGLKALTLSMSGITTPLFTVNNTTNTTISNDYGTFTINGYIDSTKATACSLTDAASYVTWTAVITPCEFNDDGSFKQLKTWFSKLASGATPYFTVQAEDWAEHSGNGKKSSNVKIATLLVDKEAPVVTITTPLDKNAAGATALNGNQTIKGTITDANQLVEAKLYVKKTSESSWGDPVKVLTTESAPAAPDENTTYNVDVSKLLNFTFSGININDYAANDGTGSADICVIAKDLAGNVTEITSQRAVDIDCDLDRPVITISDFELLENSNPISEMNPLMFTAKTVNLSVEDDDGPVAESSYRVKQVVNGSETILTATDTNAEGWTSFDISSTGTAKINLPVNAQNKQIQGKMKIEFKIKDAADAEFETAASTTQGKIKIKDNASTPHTYGTTAANYTDPTLYLLVDTNDPIVTFEGITKATAWTGTSATDTTGFTAYGEEITSSYSDLVLGGTSKYAKIRFSANDDGTGVDTSTAKVEISLDGTPVSGSPFTAVADTSTNATDDFFVIIPCTGDGTFTIKVSAKDNAGKDGQDTKQIKVDNTDPIITITAPSETTYQSGATTGTVKFNEISRLSYAISPIAPQYNAQGKLTNSPDNYTSTTSFSYDYVGNANSPVALSTTDLNTVCGYSTPLETKLKLFYIYFDGDLDSSSNTQIHTSLLNDKIISMGITTASAINSPDNPFSEIVKLYMYIKAEDEAGNMSEGVSTILVDPLGQRPTATIGYPSADGQKLGGAITLMGTATGKNQISKVYVAIAQSDDDGATWGDYGTEREAELKGSSWSLVINNPLPNGELEFDPSTDDGIKTIKVRVRAEDINGASSGYEYRTMQIDKDTPVIGQNLTLVQWKTGYNGGNGLEVKTVNEKPVVSVKAGTYDVLRNYSDKMSLGSLGVQWYLIGQVSDNNGIKSVKINGSEVVASAGTEYSDTTSGTYVKKLASDSNNYYFCIPIGESSTGYVGEKTVEFEATENKTSGAKPVRKNFTVKIDNRAPVLVTTGDGYDIATQMVNNNGFYGFGSIAKEDKVLDVEQTGVERIAFYYTRDTYSDKRLYDVMVKNDADGNKLATAGLTKSEGLYWKIKNSTTDAAFVVDGATITLSERDYNIHTGGLAKVNGTIYKISTVSADGTVITVANIIDNPTEEGAGRNKLNDIYGWGYYSDASYDDGDYMMEALRESKTATGATYQWKAYINSRNLDDGPVVLHYVAFDKAGNVTEEQTVDCTVKNNAPRIAGLKIGTDQNGDGNVTESDGDNNEYITTYHVNVTNASTLHADVTYPPQSGGTPSSIITVKGKTVIMPEILGGNGNLYYTFTVAKHNTGLTWKTPYYTDSTETQFGYGTKSDYDTHYAYAASDSTAAAAINLPVSKFVYQDKITDGKNQKFVFTVKDSTPGRSTTAETTDPQTATLSVVMNVALRDNEAAKNYIMPFYWNSLKDNSVYSSKTPTSVADLGGHIELPEDLKKADGFSGVTKPKVSGKIKIEGIAHDNNLIKTLKATVNGNPYTLASRSASAAATGYLTPETATLANDGWQVSIKKVTYGEYEAAGLGTKPNGKNATDEIGYTTQNYGHNVHWILTIDTEKLLGDTPVQEDFEISVEAEDVGQPTAASVTADDTSVTWTKNTFWNNAEKQNGQTQPPAAGQTGGNLGTDAHTCKYTVDVVPYIQGLKTKLSEKSGKTDTSEFDRTALGHYPVGENERIYIYGFNLKDGKLYDRDGTSVAYAKITNGSDPLTTKYKGQGFDVYKTDALTSFKSGPVSVKVGAIESLNNKNYNGSKGSYTKADPITSTSAASVYGAQSTYTAYNNFYNHTPNQTTNYTLTDDVVLDMWHFKPEAAKPNPSGRVDEPIMKINPKTGIIGFAFLSGPMHYAMPLNNDTSYNGNMEGANDGDYHAGNGFTYDSEGNAYAIECGGNENSSYYLHYQPNNGTLQGNDVSKPNKPSTIIDRASDTNGGNLRYKLKGASFAATSHGTDRNFYLAYYNSYRGRIHYRYGTYTNNAWTGLLGNDAGGNNTSNSQVIINGTDSTLGGAGKFISIDAKTGTATNNDIVVLVWYDEDANALKYTYNTTPTAGTTGVNTTGWKAAKTIFSGAGEYCQIKLDGAGGVHIAAKNKKGGLKYAYLSSYNALDEEGATVTTYDVDTYGSVGGHLTLDVALDTSNKPIPYISYIGANIAKIAYLKNTNRGPGVSGSKFTNNWEVSYIPSSSKILNLNDKEKDMEADSRVSVGVWKDSNGKIKNSIPGNSSASGDSGTCWGNGTANPVVAYQTQFNDADESIETAQMKN